MDSLAEAKATLLRALEQIEGAEADLSSTDNACGYVAVVYCVAIKREDGRTEEIGGWVATSEPTWATAALLRRGADDVETSRATPGDD